MFFTHPILLSALVLGLIPIIIYYLLRFRSLSVTWGANYVLELALERLKNRLNLDQIILLALRAIACMLIVLAFTRPVTRSANAVSAGTGVQHVVVLDGSYSMLAGEAGNRRFDASIDALKKLIATWGRGETWSLLFLTDEPRWVIDSQPVTSPQDTIAAVDSLRPHECSVPLDAAFALLAEKIQRGRAEVFIFTDDQAAAWKQIDRATLPAELDAPIYWFNPAGEPRTNLAVTALRAGADRVLINTPCRITASIKNFSSVKVEDVNIELLLDNSFAARQSVSLLPNQETQVRFDLKFTAPGSHSLCAQLPDDALDFDNRLFAALDVVEQLTVVELRDAGRTGKFDSSWGAIETLERTRQISAKTAGSDDSRGQIIWRLNEGACDAASLAGADVVLLDGGRKLTPELVATLRGFVLAGGGLLLAADPATDTAAWNRLLGDADLLPAHLGALHTQPVGGDRFRSLSRSSLTNSPLNIFENDAAGDLTHARFYSYFSVENTHADATPIVRFDDQSPWAIHTQTPAGHVLLLTSALNGQGNNLLVREFFVPLVYQLIQDAGAGRIFPRTVARGEAVRLRTPDDKQITGATFNRTGEDARTIPLRNIDGKTTVEIADSSLESGLYSMLTLAGNGSAGHRTWFAIQGPRTDSDLTPLSPAQLASITKQLNLTVAHDWDQLDHAIQKQRSGNEWQSWLAFAALFFLFMESLFQRRFSPAPTVARSGPRKPRSLQQDTQGT